MFNALDRMKSATQARHRAIVTIFREMFSPLDYLVSKILTSHRCPDATIPCLSTTEKGEVVEAGVVHSLSTSFYVKMFFTRTQRASLHGAVLHSPFRYMTNVAGPAHVVRLVED